MTPPIARPAWAEAAALDRERRRRRAALAYRAGALGPARAEAVAAVAAYRSAGEEGPARLAADLVARIDWARDPGRSGVRP